MSKYIKKEDALKRPYKLWNGSEYVSVVNEDYLNGLQTYSFPDSAENKGEWLDKGNGSYTCSKCKTEWTTSQIEKMCFCPTCGADMRGDRSNG